MSMKHAERFHGSAAGKRRLKASALKAAKKAARLKQYGRATPAPKKPRKKKDLPTNCICKRCGVDYRVKPNRVTTSNFCSCKCRGEAHRLPARQCVVCGSDHRLYRKTCGKACDKAWQTLRQSGEKSHRWEGGKTPEATRIRNSQSYSNWRTAVFKRDDYTCLNCGVRGGKLNADHIKPFSKFPELRLDVANGRTLCFECHKKTDTFASGASHAHQPREQGRFVASRS